MLKRTALTVAGFTLTQVAIAVGIAMTPATALAQSRPNVQETLPAKEGLKSYAQDLVDRTMARHPELLGLDIHAVPPGATDSMVVASNRSERLKKKTDADDLGVFKTGTPRVEINQSGNNNVEVAVPLHDVLDRPIGVVEMTFPYVAGTDQEALVAKATDIANQLRRRIAYGAEDLVTPSQYDARVPIDNYAQYLVDDTLVQQPGVVIIVLHAQDAAGGYPIVASNIGRIGKAADDSDLAVIRENRTNRAISADGGRLEVKMPLADATGKTIGAVAMVFPSRIADQDSLQRQAEKIRDALGKRIATSQRLLDPYPKAAPTQVVQTAYDKQELGNNQSLPMTKAVVSGDTLEQASQEGYSEAVKGVAGVSPANSKGSPNDSINIRGIKLNLFSNYRLNGGLPTAGVISTPTENKERIETLKGANALMFGVASPAGIINLVTKRAGPVDVTSVGVAGNAFGQYGANIDIGRRFGTEQQFGLRINASGAHLENGVRDMGGMGSFASVGFDMRITENLTFQSDLEYYMKRVPEQAGISLAPAVNGVVPITKIPDPRNLLSGRWDLYTPHTRNETARFDYVFSDQWKALIEWGVSDSTRSRLTTRIGNYDLNTGAGGVVAVTATSQEYENTFGRVEALGKFSTWFLTHDLTIGVSDSKRDATTISQNSTTLAQRQNIFDPIDLAPPVFTKASTTLPLQRSADTGLYFYDTVGVTTNWKLLLGMRRTKDTETNAGTKSTTTVNSPAYGALYDIMPSVTLFASYMEGLEAGGVAPATAINFNEILPSAVSTQKEIGIRDSHINGLSLNASYFEIQRANAVTDPVTKIFAANGDINYKGVEATLNYEINRRWSVSVAGQYLKSVQKAPDPTINGLDPENTPKALGNISVAHKPVWLPGLTLTAGATGIGKRFVNPQDQGTIPGYTLYSIGAGYVTRIEKRRVAFQVNVDNLMNKRYWNSVQTGTYGIGMDRQIKFNARVDF